MPVRITTEHENRLTVCVYTGIAGSDDVRAFVESLLRGDHPAEYDGLHDFSRAERFDFNPADYVRIAMMARSTWPEHPVRPKLTAAFGHNETFRPAFEAWNAFFFGDAGYRFETFDTEAQARAFLSANR